jgi:hypothetical protein
MANEHVLQLGTLRLAPIDPARLEHFRRAYQLTLATVAKDQDRNARNVAIARKYVAR